MWKVESENVTYIICVEYINPNFISEVNFFYITINFFLYLLSCF